MMRLESRQDRLVKVGDCSSVPRWILLAAQDVEVVEQDFGAGWIKRLRFRAE